MLKKMWKFLANTCIYICTYFLLLLFLPPLLLLLQNLYRVTSVAALICMPRDTGTRTQSLWLLFFQWLFLVSLPLGVAATKLALIGSLFAFLLPILLFCCCICCFCGRCDHISVVSVSYRSLPAGWEHFWPLSATWQRAGHLWHAVECNFLFGTLVRCPFSVESNCCGIGFGLEEII